MTLDQKALAPCPFCGNDGKSERIEDALQIFHSEPCEWDERHTWTVQCDKCTATMGYSDSEDEAIAAWNRRALPEAGEVAGLVERLRSAGDHYGIPVERDFAEAAAALTRQSADIARLEKERDEAQDYATRLLIALMEKHYPDRSPNWAPLPDLIGVLSQIDNLSTGLTRAETAESSLAERDRIIAEKDKDIAEFMARVGPRWFLEQNWFPTTVNDAARERRAS